MRSLSPETIEKLWNFALNAPGKKHSWITRVAMYKALEGKLKEFDGKDRRCLAISGSASLGQEILGLTQAAYTNANYPEQNMLALKYADEEFDFCISDQVLEHLQGDPFKAFAESARVIKRGGYVCHTTCLINEIHKVPGDFWRFTPDALLLLAKESRLEPVLVGAWGNREIVNVITSAKLRFAPIPDDPNNPIYQLAMTNEADWPISVWIIARKP